MFRGISRRSLLLGTGASAILLPRPSRAWIQGAAAGGGTFTSINWVAEGDSRTATTAPSGGWPGLTAPSLNLPTTLNNNGVSGSTMDSPPSVQSRLATGKARYDATPGVLNLWTLMVGVNELGGYSGGGHAYATRDCTYFDDVNSGGQNWHRAYCLELPSTDAGQNTNRALLNPDMVAAIGSHIEFVIGFGTDSIMGVDNSFTVNSGYWADPLHPNATGQARLASIVVADINAYLGTP
jgi:lysophospholipase L1-like esterase